MADATTNIDLSSLTEVDTIHARRSTDYDLRFSEKTGKFTVSDDAWSKLSLDNRSMRMFTTPDGKIVLTLVAEGDGTFLNRKKSTDPEITYKKGHDFTNNKLRRYMNEAGMEDVTLIGLSPIGQHEGNPAFLVGEYDEKEGSALSFLQGSAEEADVLTEEAPAQEDAQEAPAETPQESAPVETEEAAAEDDTPEEPADEEETEEANPFDGLV